jgi:hypothetical protein
MRIETYQANVEIAKGGRQVSATLPDEIVLRPGDRGRWRFTFPPFGTGEAPTCEVTVYRAGILRRTWTRARAIVRTPALRKRLGDVAVVWACLGFWPGLATVLVGLIAGPAWLVGPGLVLCLGWWVPWELA